MDISIYCRKPSKIELILDELEASINAIVADCHKRLDTLKAEPKPPEPIETDERYAEAMQRGMHAMQNASLLSRLLQARPGQVIPLTPSEQYALMQNTAGAHYTHGLYGYGRAPWQQGSLLNGIFL